MAEKSGIQANGFVQVGAAMERKDWPAAISILQKLYLTVSSSTGKMRASRLLALAARRSGDLALAEQTLKTHLAEYPTDILARAEVARFLEARDTAGKNPTEQYWKSRSDYVYLHVARVIAQRIAANAEVVADIGSNGTPILEWFPGVPVRYSVDPITPFKGSGIRSVTCDFLKWKPQQRVNVLTCFQVMEHLSEPGLFAQKMLRMADVCIVSVPYKWPEGQANLHIQDPVDERKMLSWFEREPNYSYRATEIFGQERLICVYDAATTAHWSTINAEAFRFRWSLRGAEDLTGANAESQVDVGPRQALATPVESLVIS
jgi:hypothetical protein